MDGSWVCYKQLGMCCNFNIPWLDSSPRLPIFRKMKKLPKFWPCCPALLICTDVDVHMHIYISTNEKSRTARSDKNTNRFISLLCTTIGPYTKRVKIKEVVTVMYPSYSPCGSDLQHCELVRWPINLILRHVGLLRYLSRVQIPQLVPICNTVSWFHMATANSWVIFRDS